MESFVPNIVKESEERARVSDQLLNLIRCGSVPHMIDGIMFIQIDLYFSHG